MKKYYLYLLLLFAPPQMAAQTTYRSYFGKEFTYWYVVNEMVDWGRYSERFSVFNQDTLLNNGISYKKGYSYFSLEEESLANRHCNFGIREETETGSLFVVYELFKYNVMDEIPEILVSRMDMEIGDKYYFPPIRYDFNDSYCWHCFKDVQLDEKGYFATVDSIYYKDDRKHIRFDANYNALTDTIPFTFIEGIGPNISFAPLIEAFSRAICCNCYEDETGVWKSDIKIKSIDYSQSDCFFEITEIPKIGAGFSVQFTIREGEIELQTDAVEFKSGQVYVYSVEGKLCYTQQINAGGKTVVSTSGFPSGVYIVQLRDSATKKTWETKVFIGN